MSALHQASRPAGRDRAVPARPAGAQQFRLATQSFQPAGGTIARTLDALQALLAALADRDQLSLDLAAAIDRQADGVGLRALGNDQGSLLVERPGAEVEAKAMQRKIGGARRKSRGLSHAEAATLPTAGLTAWRALVVDGGLKAGDVVLVLGTGGVSIFALQIAKMTGATVIATSSSDEKLERVRAMGGDLTINYRQHDDWGVRTRDWTGGHGVDHVIEVGGPGTLAQSIVAVRVGGHISLIGVLTGLGGEVPTAALMAKQARLQGLIVGNRRHQVELVRAIDATGLRPVIDRTFALAEIADAFRHEESGVHFGKICLEF
jgi:NADPH:quinone reductase-like Zn-dependent oxidoreductase